MAWDATRPVPWKRLLTFFALYAGIAIAVLTVLNGFDPSILGGLLMGGSVYVMVAVVLVKFGWNPPAFRSKAERQAAAAERSTASTKTVASDAPRPRPAPTSRTSTGPTNRPRRTRETRRR